MKGNESIIVDYPLNEAPEQIWRALTEPPLLAKWLMENDIQPIVGHKFNFRAKPIGDWDGIVHCEILEVDPPHKLVYTWQGGTHHDGTPGPRLDTTVTWTLTPTPTGGTLLHLVHHGFQPDDYSFQIMSNGWRKMLPAEKMTNILAVLQD
jgi:uncharacterized protein YndB with AHSA1/START domain